MYYLIKKVDKVPFILGQFVKREAAEIALEVSPKKLGVKYEVVASVEETDQLINSLRDTCKSYMGELQCKTERISKLKNILLKMAYSRICEL